MNAAIFLWQAIWGQDTEEYAENKSQKSDGNVLPERELLLDEYLNGVNARAQNAEQAARELIQEEEQIARERQQQAQTKAAKKRAKKASQ